MEKRFSLLHKKKNRIMEGRLTFLIFCYLLQKKGILQNILTSDVIASLKSST